METCEYCGSEMFLDHSYTGTDGRVYQYWDCPTCKGESEPLAEPWELTDLDCRFLRALGISPD